MLMSLSSIAGSTWTMVAFASFSPFKAQTKTISGTFCRPLRLRLPKKCPREHESCIPIGMFAERQQRLLVLGGTGRVGTETIKALSRHTPVPLVISVAGRDSSRGHSICRDLTRAAKVRGEDARSVQYQFTRIDINDEVALAQLIAVHDMVIHTAGPFQKAKFPTRVLRTAMTANVPYMDVCDDLTHAMECKKLHDAARAKGYIALISTGIYPGLSNLMAAEASTHLGEDQVRSLRIYYHTAGTGGIGATVLASTFLILSEDVTCYDESGKEERLPSAGNPEVVDFGGRLGRVTAYLLNLPEVVSLHDNLFKDGPGTELFAKFSTGPPIWNWLLQSMAKWAPKEWLANQSAMLAFSQLSIPVVRAVDVLSGALTAIKVVVNGNHSSFTYSFEHDSLAKCVGEATASFAFQMLKTKTGHESSSIGGGVFFPEELSNGVRAEIMKNATLSANLFQTESSANG